MTVQEFQMQLQSVKLDDFFTEILPVGQCNSQVIVAQVPNRSGLCFTGSLMNEVEIFKQYENIAFTILSALSKEKANITILDSQYTTLFPSLRKLDNQLSLVSWITNDTLQDYVLNLINRNKRITSNYLNDEITSINQFNQKFPERLIQYEFLIIPSLHQVKELEILEKIVNISKFAIQTGLFIITNFDTSKVKPPHKFDDDFVPKVKSLLNQLKSNMSNVDFSSNDHNFINFPLPITNFTKSYPFTFFEFNKSILLPAIVSKHENKNQSSQLDFIEIPIGTEGHKPIYLKFGDKSNRGGFIAGKQGSGKSSLLRTIILEIIKKYTPNEVKLILFDMKGSAGAFGFLENLQHVELIVKGNQCLSKALNTLKQKIHEIESKRIETYKSADVSDNLSEFVRKTGKKLPVYLIIYDEGHHLLDKYNSLFNEIQGHIAKELRYVGVYHLFASQFISTWSNFKDEYRINIDVSICGQLDDDMDKPPKFSKIISTLGLRRMRMAIEDDTVNVNTSVFDLRYIEKEKIINQAKQKGYWLNYPQGIVIEGSDEFKEQNDSNDYTNTEIY